MPWRLQWRKMIIYLLLIVGGAAFYHLTLERQSRSLERVPNSAVNRANPVARNNRARKRDQTIELKHYDYEEEEELLKLVSNSFHFPQPHYSKPDRVLLRSSWVRSLKEYLDSIEGKQVSLVTSSKEHTDILLNWLISAYLIAKPPLKNVLVLSMDRSLHDIMEIHGFSSLYVTADMVISPRANITRVFSQVHIVRLTVIRLINHLGFDVVNYDCDAILLKNPQQLFDSKKDVDLIGTFGRGPVTLYRKWGVTLNTGVMVMRANPQIEFFWETMAKREWTTTDDQNSINLVLDSLNINWVDFKKGKEDIEKRKYDIFGLVRLSKPKFKMFVSLLSFERVCRRTCEPERRSDYFVWHALAIAENRTVANKMNQALLGRAWFLSERWEELTMTQPTLQQEEWLKFVMSKSTCEWTGICD